ncbi:MAG: hypothetical protein HZA54_19535, partial [Planctomycetes bacterium]|nr:hypothetical protein [Planctomycetota bacterium]
WLAATYGLTLRTGLGRGGDPPAERILLVAGAIAALAAPLVSWVCRTLGRAAARAWAGGRAMAEGVKRLGFVGLALGLAFLPAWLPAPIPARWSPLLLAAAAAPLLVGAWRERRGREGPGSHLALAPRSAAGLGAGLVLGAFGSGLVPPAYVNSSIQAVALFGLLSTVPLLSAGCATIGEALWPNAACAVGIALAYNLMELHGKAALPSAGSLAAVIACVTALPLLAPGLRCAPRPPDWNLFRRGGIVLASLGLAAGAFVALGLFRGTPLLILPLAAALLAGLGALVERRAELNPRNHGIDELSLGGYWLLGLAFPPWVYICDANRLEPLGPPFLAVEASTLAAWILLPALFLSCALSAASPGVVFWNLLLLGEGVMLGALQARGSWSDPWVDTHLLPCLLVGVFLFPIVWARVQRRFRLRPRPGLGLAGGLLVASAMLLAALLLS